MTAKAHKFKKRWKIIGFSGIILLALIVTVLIYLSDWLNERRKNAAIIQDAIAHPQTIKPEKFLNTIDKSFRSLSRQKKREILKDPEQVEKYVAEATCRELQKSFRVLFCLPESVRKEIIRTSAERLLNSARKKPQKTAAVFKSAGGRGGLKGASAFFLLHLNGSEKAELAPLTAAVFEIARQQFGGKRLQNPGQQ
jgi:hypothetical protein